MAKFTTPKVNQSKKKSPKSKKTVRRTVSTDVEETHVYKGWKLKDYRKYHKKIPGKVYNTRDVKEKKKITRSYYGPLGRPPASRDKREEYNHARVNYTPSGKIKREKEIDRQTAKDRWTDKEYARYVKDMDSWNDEMSRRNYDLNMRDEEIEIELEDRGYSDYRKNWKRMSSRNKAKAYREKVYEDWRTYNDY